ncbi:HAD-IIA family hydrolase [Leucobacter aridicollis]|uniref:HAD superfamily hydrolase (TIGR01450 family) n=1 Tax=Leucobacter aridicollis TaxID=283878 RepID=A0A852R1W4_9MICO|nr:HAD-IIA family hydrolase [Leucobacter aridicollis]MBL3682233.1 HAD-IIA family hydrolase [Leucobacter aridicollis]NYD25645.1 HAD superfamily hydrolase (TIGR01450 family) [Leucobacter aridicollis]
MALFGRREKFDPAPLEGREVLLTDLDGVIYRGHGAIAGAVEALNLAAERARVGYVTNNAARTDATVAAHLSELGLRATAADVITSPQAAVALLREVVAPGSRVLVVGGEGLTHELEKAGFEWTRSAEDSPVAVVQGFAKDVGWEHLAEAAYALQEEPGREPLPWIATNTDWTVPRARGIAPGNGTLVSAVHTAVQRLPDFAGKPETPIYEAAFERFGSRNALMLGDRLDTDIKGAVAAGIPSLFVLTGVDRPKQLIAASADMRPDYIVASLAELHEPYQRAETLKDGTVRVGGAKVRMDGHIVTVVAEGDTPMELLRAGCGAIWASGLAIYGLKVPEILVEDHWR